MTTPKLTRTIELARWMAWAQRRAAEDWVRARKLSFEQAFVLAHLTREPGAIQREIARVTRTTAASVSGLLKGLESRGFIERRMEDGDDRSKRVFATPAGRKLVSGLEAAMAAAEDAILAPLSGRERQNLHALLQKITARLPQPAPR